MYEQRMTFVLYHMWEADADADLKARWAPDSWPLVLWFRVSVRLDPIAHLVRWLARRGRGRVE